MRAQSNNNQYTDAKLVDLKKRLAQRNSSFSKAVIKDFYHAANQRDLHGPFSPEIKSFFNFLNNLIKTDGKSVKAKVLSERLENDFGNSNSPENTMWQIRFINYVFDNQMRQQLHMMEPEQRVSFAGIRPQIKYDSRQEEWNVSKHQSFGRNSRAFEQPFHIYDDFPRSVVTFESLDENYSSQEEQVLLGKVRHIALKTFTPENLLKTPEINLKTQALEEMTDQEKVSFINARPIDQALRKLIKTDTRDAKVLLEIAGEKHSLADLLINFDEESSLLDLYLYRVNAIRDGKKIVNLHNSAGEKLDFDLGFDPKNYKGKEGRKMLALEAYEFFLNEAKDSPYGLLDYIFNPQYQLEINLRKAHHDFKTRLNDVGKVDGRKVFNMNLLVDIGDDILAYSIGDSILLPMYKNDLYSTQEDFNGIKETNNLGKYDIFRLDLGKKAAKKPKGKAQQAEYFGGIFPKQQTEAFFLASRSLVNNRLGAKGNSPKKSYRLFFNNVIAPYVNNSEDRQRDKDQKFLADVLGYTSPSNALSLYLLSHKIGDDSDQIDFENSPVASFDFDPDPGSEPSDSFIPDSGPVWSENVDYAGNYSLV